MVKEKFFHKTSHFVMLLIDILAKNKFYRVKSLDSISYKQIK